MNNQVLTHRWESLGLGKAPFKLVGLYQLPSAEMAEKNTNAYNAQLQAMPRGYGIGSCGVCGMGLVNNYLINSTDGKKFAVGCDCVQKTNDTKLISVVHAKKLREAREKAQAKRDAKHEAKRIETELKLQNERDTNGGLTNWELEQQNKKAELLKLRNERLAILAPIINAIPDNDFFNSMAESLLEGRKIYGRGVDILINKIDMDLDDYEALLIKAGIEV